MVFINRFSHETFMNKYSKDRKETWSDTSHRVVDAVCNNKVSSYEKQVITDLVNNRSFIPAGRYLYAAGRPFHQVNNCFLFRATDSREGWAKIVHDATLALMTGGGIGVDYSLVRPEGSIIEKTGGHATGPISLMNMVNECGRYIMQGGQRRSAIWAGLQWDHQDILKFMNLKNHKEELKSLKSKDLNFHLPMELTNISTIYNKGFFEAYAAGSQAAKDIWMLNCLQAFMTAEPGFSFNYNDTLESLRNACCEVVSSDNGDKCNLGTIWLNRYTNIEDFRAAVRFSTLFLLCGGIYSDLPSEEIREVGNRNNRIGLGLGGFHEWLIRRGYTYKVTDELHEWLHVYEYESNKAADEFSDRLGVARPKGVRAIAPNGTIGIIAETTTGIEPLFCKAYKRRYYKDGDWHYSYVVDGAVKRLMDEGVNVKNIQDSYDIEFEDRVKFQYEVQKYVDMSISSTCNMPSWGSYKNNENTVEYYANILMKYAPGLRGFTCYPDGCRGGQPLTACSIEEAVAKEGFGFRESLDVCDLSKGGTCGS